MWSGCKEFEERVVTKLREIFQVGKLRRQNKDDTLTDTEQKSLRSLTGQILWASSHTRPGVAFKASCLASNLDQSTVQTVLDANKVVRQLKAESVQLMFQPLGNRDVAKLVIYSDASAGNLPDGGNPWWSRYLSC